MIRTYTKMHVSTEIKNQVRSIESEISKRKESASVLRRKKERSENRLEDMTKDFGLREHLFCGRFGGDRRGVAKARILKGYISDYDSKIRGANRLVAEFEKNIDTAIAQYLSTGDDAYRRLDRAYKKASYIREQTSYFIGRIDDALSEISDAEMMETVDLFTKNKGISLLSTLENSEAEDAANDVKDAIPAYQAKLNEYDAWLDKKPLQGLAEIDIGDGIDLIFDLAFDGFDFMSIFTLSSLSDAEDQLNELRDKVVDIKRELDKHYKQADDNRQRYIDNVRREC